MPTNETVLITGASRGIGFATATQFADAGYTVIGTSRTDDGVARIEAAGQSRSGRLTGVRLDLADPGHDDDFHAAVTARTPQIDVLICNAGIMIPSADLAGQSVQDWRAVLEVNLTGPFRTVRALLPLLRNAAAPRTILLHGGLGNISSGMEGGGFLAYRTSKAGLAALTMSLANDSGIALRACGYDPGWVATDLGGADAPGRPEDCAKDLVKLADRMNAEKLTGVLVRGESVTPW